MQQKDGSLAKNSVLGSSVLSYGGGDQEPKGLPLGPAKNLDITSRRSFPA